MYMSFTDFLSSVEVQRLLASSAVRLRVLSSLGRGVYKVCDEDGATYAAKICKASDAPLGPFRLESKFGQLLNEWKLLSGPLLGCPGVPRATCQTIAGYMMLLQQPFGVPLKEYQLPRNQQMKEQFLLKIGSEVAAILKHIQMRGVMHRDVQPGNIIITDDGPIIIDFGMAILMEDEHRAINTQSRVGTLAYSSNFSENRQATPSDDFKSLAFTCHALSVGIPQWEQNVRVGSRPSLRQVCQDDVLARSIVDDAAAGSDHALGLQMKAAVAVGLVGLAFFCALS